MKHGFFIVLISPILIHCMQKDLDKATINHMKEEIYAPHDADSIVFSVLHPKCTCEPEDAIWYIKELLQDDKLSSPHSKNVQKILVDKLLEYDNYDSTVPSQAYQQKEYPHKENSYFKLIQLTFEDFVKVYCQARLQFRQKKSENKKAKNKCIEEDHSLQIGSILIPTY
jgi:hypothetical protein